MARGPDAFPRQCRVDPLPDATGSSPHAPKKKTKSGLRPDIRGRKTPLARMATTRIASAIRKVDACGVMRARAFLRASSPGVNAAMELAGPFAHVNNP